MKVSVVITCYTEGDALLRAVNSCKRQTVSNFELLIINDASPCDQTNRICKQLEEKQIAGVIWRKENEGLSAARNTGYEEMSGEVCVPLDADDELPDDCIHIIQDIFSCESGIGFVFGNYRRINVDDGSSMIVDCSSLSSSSGHLDPKKCLEHWILYGGSPCRKTTWQAVGGYDQDFSYGGQDVDFWMKVFKEGISGHYINSTIYHWYRSSGGMNARRSGNVENRLGIVEKNMETYDVLGLRIEGRKKLMKGYLLAGKYTKAKKYARQLLRMKMVSLPILLVAILPGGISRKCYMTKTVYGKSRVKAK